MGSFTSEEQASRLGNIQRGSYYFGIIGRLSVCWGALALVLALFAIVGAGGQTTDAAVKLLASAIPSLLYGWLFLLGRDALDAVSDLIKDMQQIV